MSENILSEKYYCGVEETPDTTTYWTGIVLGSPAPGWFLIKHLNLEGVTKFDKCELRRTEDMVGWQFFWRREDATEYYKTVRERNAQRR